MTTLNIRVPDSLCKQLQTYAQRDSTTIDQLVSSAVAEKLASLMTEDYLAARAARGDRRRFEAVLATVPNVEPLKHDRLPRAKGNKRRKPGNSKSKQR